MILSVVQKESFYDCLAEPPGFRHGEHQSEIIVEDDKFIIIPPYGYEDSYKNDKLEYPNTKEGLVEAFFNTLI